MDFFDDFRRVRDAAFSLAALDESRINAVLLDVSGALNAGREAVLEANRRDLALMPEVDPRYDRLLLNGERIAGMAADAARVAGLTSPVGRILGEHIRSDGLKIRRVSVPLGVVGIIYEARPNVTSDVFTLCFKTGNACILKGGKEAYRTNEACVRLIHEVLARHDIDPYVLYLMPPQRECALHLLRAEGFVDVCIPRGSDGLIRFVRENARVPVIETGAGIVHVYFDRDGDTAKGRDIITNAKTRRVSVCNALDALLVHQARLCDLAALTEGLLGAQTVIYADEECFAALQGGYRADLLHRACPEDFGREFLANKLAVKAVGGLDEALAHIRAHSSKHSEAIVTENPQTAAAFTAGVDAAVVYTNASTAFTDGGEFGLGAEIGISTQKLHARGPMGLEALVSCKWCVEGSGHIR